MPVPSAPSGFEVDELHRVMTEPPGAAQVDKTLRHLATAGHRTLTDPAAGELRANLARMDSILARLDGEGEGGAAEGADEIARILRRMGAIAASSRGAPHLAQFQRLIDERRGQLRKVIQRDHGPLRSDGPRRELRLNPPALDRLLRDSSQAQLAAQLAKAGAGSLQRLSPAPASSALAGVAQPLVGAAPVDFTAGHRAGGLGARQGGLAGAMSSLAPHLAAEARGGRPADARRVLSGMQRAPAGTALHELAKRIEEKNRVAARSRRPRGSAKALLEALQRPQNPGMARHLQANSALLSLCERAQRGHGLPVGQAGRQDVGSRGSNRLWSAVQTFHSLLRDGHKPHCWSLSSIAHAMKDGVSSALHDVSATVGGARGLAAATAQTVRQGLSGLPGGAAGLPRRAQGLGSRALHGAEGAFLRGAHLVESGEERWARAGWGGIRGTQASLAHVADAGMQAMSAGAHWAHDKVGQTGHWSRDKVHAGLEWLRKTGVVGAVGTGLRPGLSSVGSAPAQTPFGLAVRAAQRASDWAKHGGLARAWHGAQHLAGRALEGLKAATHATSSFLQSPGGQLLVTGLSLAASFIPGGLVVKAVIGGGIGALQAISEGKDWKGVLASAAGGALIGALPFMKMGPLAKLGIGALQGGLTALASGGSFKDALKGAAGGALDSVDPGAFHALKRLKGFTTAEKLLKGKALSKAEKALLERGKLAAPLRALEMAMSNPRMRRSMGALERAAGKAVKGGVWVSGKAARAQRVLDQAVRAGDHVHGVLSQVHDLAPGLAEALGDNAAGHFVGALGEWAGKGDGALSGALERGHQASDLLHQSRGVLDKGLGSAGVKNPAKADRRMMARKGGRPLEHVEAARRVRRGHRPELDLARANTRRTGGEHGEVDAPRSRAGHGPQGRLERALARGRTLIREGEAVADGVHEGLGKVHVTVAHGLLGAEEIQRGLEGAARLARSGAGLVGEESELGSHLLELSDRADRIHGSLQQGIDLAGSFDEKIEGVEGALEKIPGVHAHSPLEKATHLEGRHRHRGHPHPEEQDGETPHLGDPDKAARASGKGMRLGRHVEVGLDKAAHLAGSLARMLGEDEPIGQLAGQLEEAAHGGYDKLHEALAMTARGKPFLHKGRELFQRGVGEMEKEARHALPDQQRFSSPLAGGQRPGPDALRPARGGSDPGPAAAASEQHAELRRHFAGSAEGPHGLAGEKTQEAGRATGLAGLPSHGRRYQGGRDDPGFDLLEEGRLHVHRGAIRGSMGIEDGQQVESAAPDGWIGSGEGVKVFSEVFGAFLPAEVAAATSQSRDRRRQTRHGRGGHGRAAGRAQAQGRTGFFKGLFDHLHDFADRVAGWAHTGESVLGKGMHLAETGMHGLSWLENAAERTQGIAGKAEGFLDRIGLHQMASFAGRIGEAAGWADGEASLLHGGLEKADRWMGKGKALAGEVAGGARVASDLFAEASEGRVLHLFKASRSGDGIDGRTAPERVRLGSALDEPRRLDVTTLSRMEGFLGGSLAGVRIHTGPGAAEVTGRFNAEAVTVQDHIFFAPGRFNPASIEGQRLLAHELTHVLQKGRPNLDVRTAETEALRAEHGLGSSPDMTTLDLRQPRPDWKLPDGMGTASQGGVHTAKRNRSRGDDAAAKDTLPDGEEFLEQVSGRVYDLLMEELEHSFESR